MKLSRVAAMAVVALTACPRPSVTPPTSTGEYAEWQQMCAVCANPDENLDCFAYGASDGGAIIDSGSCTYPPCNVDTYSATVGDPHKKLMCASCRAMCPDTAGRPGATSTASPKR